MKLSQPLIAIIVSILLAATTPAGADSCKTEKRPPPMRSLLQLDLDESQLKSMLEMVKKTESIRHNLGAEYRQLCEKIQQAERSRKRDEKKIRELKRLQVANREVLRTEKERFHQQVEEQLDANQSKTWSTLRKANQKWCQSKWMRCSNCTCDKK